MADKTTSVRVPVAALVPFLAIAFGLAWSMIWLLVAQGALLEGLFGPPSGSHPFFVLAVYAPAIAALAVVGFCTGRAGLRRFLGRLLLWRAPRAWYAVLLLGIPVMFWAGALVKGEALAPASGSAAGLLGAMAFMAVLGPVEEIGWRGLALPLLQRRMAPLIAALVLGAIWGLWHLPAFYLEGTPQSAWGFLPFFAGSVAVSVMITALFNASGGSILLAALFHFQLINPLWPDAQPYDTAFFVLAAVATAWIGRRRMLARGGGLTEVVPGEGASARA